VHDCELLCLGDLVEGENIYKLQLAHIDRDLFSQTIDCAGLLADNIRYLSGMFRTVTVRHVRGNHGRTDNATVNFDDLCMWAVERLVRDLSNVQIIASLSPALVFAKHAPNGGWRNYLCAHGENIKRSMRVPYYGIDRAFGDYQTMTGEVLDAAFIGHHHVSASFGAGRGQKYVNGTFVGATNFTVGELVAATQPSQMMLTYHEEVGITSDRRIYLAPQTKIAEPDEFGMRTPWRRELVAA
jgi:hypothetical protein